MEGCQIAEYADFGAWHFEIIGSGARWRWTVLDLEESGYIWAVSDPANPPASKDEARKQAAARICRCGQK